jgi:excisionase family DNA binding protein
MAINGNYSYNSLNSLDVHASRPDFQPKPYKPLTGAKSKMPASHIEKSYCTTREAATLLGVSVGTVQLWVESGVLQAWKTAGGHRRVLRDSVDSLLRKEPRAVIATAPATVSVGPRRLRVLVVEDDPALLRLYQVKLSRWPMQPEVRTSADGFEALMRISECWPDLLIVDMQMPYLDGSTMLQSLQKTPEMANATIVVVTGLDTYAIEKCGGVPPGVEVLPKPIPFDQLLAIATGIVPQISAHVAAS